MNKVTRLLLTTRHTYVLSPTFCYGVNALRRTRNSCLWKCQRQNGNRPTSSPRENHAYFLTTKSQCVAQSSPAQQPVDKRFEAKCSPLLLPRSSSIIKKKKKKDNTTTLPPPNHPADNGHSSIVVGLYIV